MGRLADALADAIGVQGLSACSVFAIVSPHAAAVAHIGPNVPGSTDVNSYIRLAQDLARDTVSLCTAQPTLFPPGSKTHIICSTVNNNPITAPEQVRAMYQAALTLPHNNTQWQYYEQSNPLSINPQTHLGTVFIDGRYGAPRVYVEDRDVTDAAGDGLMWTYNGRFQLQLGTVVLEDTLEAPLNTWIYMNGKWSQWDGHSWRTQ